MSRRYVAGALLLLVSLTACVMQSTTAIRRDSVATVDPGRREALTARAIEVLQGRGFIFALIDHGAGVITSRPRSVLSLPCDVATFQECEGMDVAQVSVSPRGRVSVTLVRELYFGRGLRAAQTPNEVAAVEAEQDAILGEITGLPVSPRPPALVVAPAPPPAGRPGLECPASSKLVQAWLRADATLLADPGSTGGALGTLVAGTPVCAVDWRQLGFRKVRLDHNREGWLPETALEFASQGARRSSL